MARFKVGEKVRHALKGKSDMLVDDVLAREDGSAAYRCSWVDKDGETHSAEFAESSLVLPPPPFRGRTAKIASMG